VFRIAFFGDSMTEGVQVNLESSRANLRVSRPRTAPEWGLSAPPVLQLRASTLRPVARLALFREKLPPFLPRSGRHSLFLDSYRGRLSQGAIHHQSVFDLPYDGGTAMRVGFDRSQAALAHQIITRSPPPPCEVLGGQLPACTTTPSPGGDPEPGEAAGQFGASDVCPDAL